MNVEFVYQKSYESTKRLCDCYFLATKKKFEINESRKCYPSPY